MKVFRVAVTRQIKRRLIIFSAYVLASHFILGVHVLRAINFWAFWPSFLAYITPVLPLTEAVLPTVYRLTALGVLRMLHN